MKTQATPKTATVKITNAKNKKSPVQKPLVKGTTDASHGEEKVVTNFRPLADEIAARAYQIWQQQGCPEGREDQHWRQAEREASRDGSSTFIP